MVGAADSSSNVGGFVNIVMEKGAGVFTTVGWFVNIRMDDGAIVVGADVIDAKVGCDVVGSLVASVELMVGTDVVGATVVGSLVVGDKEDEEPSVGEEDDGMFVVGEVEERLLVDTVGRVLDIGIDEEEEDDPLPDMVGSNVGSSDDSSPEVVLLVVGTAEGDNTVPAGEGDSVIDPPDEEDEILGDGEEEAPSPPSDDDDGVGFNVVGKPVGE